MCILSLLCTQIPVLVKQNYNAEDVGGSAITAQCSRDVVARRDVARAAEPLARAMFAELREDDRSQGRVTMIRSPRHTSAATYPR